MLMTQAHAHDIVDVFSPSFRANGADDNELFLEKEKFAMFLCIASKLILVALLFVSGADQKPKVDPDLDSLFIPCCLEH